MKQKVIANTDPDDFQNEVNVALSDGWRVIPNTLTSTSAVSSCWAEWFGGRTETQYAYSFTALLEKE